jgi:four helix bundle protein
MTAIKTFHDLKVWQQAIRYSVQVYEITSRFPRDERFGLTMQVRKSSASVSANIAEGYGRGSRQDYIRFLKIARGSLYESDSQLHLARELGFLSTEALGPVLDTLGHCERALAGLLRSLESGPKEP